MTNKQKQLLLQFLGLYNGAIDGIWGPKSQEAMKAVREKYEAMEETSALLRAVADWKSKSDTFWDEIKFFVRSEFKCTCGGRG